jgi:hypothetical protein
MAKMLMAAFATPDAADRALYELERFGYSPQEISVISRHNSYQSTRATADPAATGSDVPGSAAAGATTGGILGGLAGLLAGVGVLPALAGLFIGGPIAAALGLAGAAATTVSGAVTGAAAGGLLGALIGIGVPRDTAESYDRAVSSGGVVVGLTGHESKIGEARAILERSGAQDISEIDARTDATTTRAGLTTRDTTAAAAPTITHEGGRVSATPEEQLNYTPQRHEPAFGERPAPNTTRDTSETEDV